MVFQGKCLNLRDQVDLFEATIKVDLETQFESPAKLSEYLSKSIFIVSIGSNDYINNYLEPEIYDASRRYNPQAFAKLLTDVLSQQFQVHSFILKHPLSQSQSIYINFMHGYI